MWQKFTQRARKAIFFGQEEALILNDGYVGTEHILVGLTREPDSAAVQVLEQLGVNPVDLRNAMLDAMQSQPGAGPSSDMTLTPRAKRVIDLAYDEARNLDHNYIGTEHLLLGIIKEGEGLAGQTLRNRGVTLEAALRRVIEIQDERWPADGTSSSAAPGPKARTDIEAVALLGIRHRLNLPTYLALMILSDAASAASQAVKKLGKSVNSILTELENSILYQADERVHEGDDWLAEAMQLARDEAELLDDAQPRSEHLLLALMFRPGTVSKIFSNNGITLEDLRDALRDQDAA